MPPSTATPAAPTPSSSKLNGARLASSSKSGRGLGPRRSVRGSRVAEALGGLAVDGRDAGVDHPVVAAADLPDGRVLDAVGVEGAGEPAVRICVPGAAKARPSADVE